jgi:dolichol-phosphate mannosyltransferase
MGWKKLSFGLRKTSPNFVKTLIIIPSYNEQDNIARLCETLLSNNSECEVLVVDDSSDSTADIIKEEQKNEPRLHLIKRNGKGGRGTAVLDGFKFALEREYERIAEMDADFSHNPEEFSTLLKASGPNVMVIGSRYSKGSQIVGWPLSRRLFSKCANFYASCVLGIGIHDYTNGYRVYGREALQKLDMSKITGIGYIVLSEISYQLFKKGVQFVEVPTVFVNRRRGVSNFSWKEIQEAFTSVIRIKLSYGK